MFDVGAYKHQLIMDIISDEDIVKAIDSKLEGFIPEQPDTLIYKNVFPYMHIPKIQTSTETYIMMACDVPKINASNKAFHDIIITIRVMAHQDNLKMNGEANTRIDYISNKLTALLDDSLYYGVGRLQLTTNREIILNERYIYRELTFRTVDSAGGLC